MAELNRKTVQEFQQANKHPIIIVLDNVRSMHNVGSVFRSADAFLVDAIYLCGYTPCPPHRDIHKTALGATETVAWKYFPNTLEALRVLKEDGYEPWAVEQVHGSIPLDALEREENEKIALIFGNEAEGVASEVIPECKGCLEIPQQGMKHSLNISVAVGIVLWEMVREHQQ